MTECDVLPDINASSLFYKKLSPFTVFSELMEDRHYRKVPDDWVVVLTDIKGSTQAIAENRYKDVNLLGAASIVAILNRISDRSIPFVFGGDGATILIHQSELERIAPALQATLRLARETFRFEMRIGVVPVSELSAQGFQIEVAKFGVSAKASFAMIRGGGVSAAEKIVKSGRNLIVETVTSTDDGESAFEGLSCRWNPVLSRRGEMVSLLILAKGENAKKTYRDVLEKIDSILSSDSQAVSLDKIDSGVRLSNLKKEFDIHSVGQSLLSNLRRIFRIAVEVVTMRILIVTGWSMGDFSAQKYAREMVAQSDSKKFDDMLRMIRDCSREELQQIEAFLDDERRAGRLNYGLHASNEAMVTCLVFHLDDHIHFVDGGDGGYALAAKRLKEQVATSTSVEP